MVDYKKTPEENRVIREEKERLQHLQLMFKKILQVYRIRLNFLRARHQLLTTIEHNFENIGSFKGRVNLGKNESGNLQFLTGQEAFFHKLSASLGREKKILHLLKNEDVYVGGELLHTLGVLEKYRDHYNPIVLKERYKEKHDYMHYRTTNYGELRNMNWGRIKNILDGGIGLTLLMQADLSKIERRIGNEESFLKKENRNPKYFNNFILSWDNEVRANRKLIGCYKRILAKHGNGIVQSSKHSNMEEGLNLLAGGWGFRRGIYLSHS